MPPDTPENRGTAALCEHDYPVSHWIGLPTGNDPDGLCPGPAPGHLPDDHPKGTK